MTATGLQRKLVMYGIGAAAAGGAAEGQAGIVYSGPISLSGQKIYFDLQNTVAPSLTLNAADDFVLRQAIVPTGFGNTVAESFIYDVGSLSSGIAYNTRMEGSVLVAYTTHVTAGQTIGAGTFNASPYFNSFGTNYGGGAQGYGGGDWFSGTRGFVSLRLTISGQNYYGWAELQTNNFDNSSPGSFTLFGYAFNNTPNTPILAGAIPEPSSLALLAAGAAGVALWRRRKK